MKFMESFLKLSPVILLGGLVISGIDILISASLSFFVAAVICTFTEKIKLTEVIDCGVEGAKPATLLAFILMLAYAIGSIFMSSGVAAATIQLFIGLGVTGRSVALIAFLTTCMLAVATGTSWGTFAACIPIFMWLCNVVGGNPGMTFAACVGGSAFGDNIGLISDTTILSSGMQGVKVVDRFRRQAPWSVLCLVAAGLCFYFVSVRMGLPTVVGDTSKVLSSMSSDVINTLAEERPSVLILLKQVQTGVPLYLIVPPIIVIVMALMRYDTLICLFSGIVFSIVFGFVAGTITSLRETISLIMSGFGDAGSWAIIMLFWAMGFGGVMRRMNAFDPLARFFVHSSRKVRHLITYNGILCLLINGTLNEEMSQMAAIGPVIKNIVNDNVEGSEENKYILLNRNALFSDAVGVHTAPLIPWHTGTAYYMGLASAIYPLYQFGISDLYYNYMSLICVFSIYILTFFGWDRFIPLFGLPSEPEVRLKKEEDHQVTKRVKTK